MMRRFLQWFFRNRETGAITIAQAPNLALWISPQTKCRQNRSSPPSRQPSGIRSNPALRKAFAVPKTEVEDAYLGEVSQTVKTQAAEIAGQQNIHQTVSEIVEDLGSYKVPSHEKPREDEKSLPIL
jgi:hypothetical protein